MQEKSWMDLLSQMGFFGFIVWGVQKIISNSSDRKMADYKSQIDERLLDHKRDIDAQLLSVKSQYDSQIEHYRSQLKFLNDQLISLHTERLKIIKDLYDKLVRLRSAMLELVSMRAVDPDPEKDKQIEEDRLKNVQKTYEEFNNLVLFNRIYFTESLAIKLDQIRQDYFDAQWDVFEPKRLVGLGLTSAEAYRESAKKVIDASKRIRNEIPIAIKDIENELRQILGVDTN